MIVFLIGHVIHILQIVVNVRIEVPVQNVKLIMDLLKMIEVNVYIFLKINIIQMIVFLIGHVVIFLRIVMNVKVKLNVQNVKMIIFLLVTIEHNVIII